MSDSNWWLPSNSSRIEHAKKKFNIPELERVLQLGLKADAPQYVHGLSQARMDYVRAMQQKKKRYKIPRVAKNMDVDQVFEKLVQSLLTIPETNPYVGLDSIAFHLGIKPHLVKHALMRANREGWCSQAMNSGVHDTHRDYMGWGGPWVSSWRTTIFQLNTEKMRATHGQTQMDSPTTSNI